MPAKGSSKATVYQLKVTLKDSRPPIWRRIQVPGDITLYKLHQVLQVVMDWTDSHLHQFIIGGRHYGEPDPEFQEVLSERRVKLSQVVRDEKARFVYEYDFGDDWLHQIVVEKILPPEEGKSYPVCLSGKRAAPPEDCGGIWGYYELLETLSNPDDAEYAGMLEWAGGPIDPEEFDLDEINQALRRLR